MTSELSRILIALIVSIMIMIALSRYLNLHAFFCLIVSSLVLGIIVGQPFSEVVTTMQLGFGVLLQQIGFIVAIGSCLGMVMEKTGAMQVISETIIDGFGKQRSVIAMSFIGWMIGIPVFCDSGFIILSKLIPSIAAQSNASGASLALSLSAGLYSTHTLVPPTPGPLAAASTLGLSNHLGEVILITLLGSLPVAFVAYLFADRVGRKIPLAEFTHKSEPLTQRASRVKAFLPLLVPIALITSATIPKAFAFGGIAANILTTLGQPVIALLIGLALSFGLVPKSEKSWPLWVTEALQDAGIIILITGAGGAFGYVIKSTGVDLILRQQLSSIQTEGAVFLGIAFIISAVLKTAQGSTTSSLIITSALLAPLATSAGFDTPRELTYLMLAISGGAMTVSHANDSYFWVVSQFGGISSRDMFKTFTLATLLQGITALLTSMLLFILW